MQSIYNYIPDTNHISRVRNVAAILQLLLLLLLLLFYHSCEGTDYLGIATSNAPIVPAQDHI